MKFRRHPLVEELPTLPPESADYCRIRASIEEDGIREALKCVQDGELLLVLDGLHRLKIAEELGIDELPYQTIGSADPVLFVCASAVRAGWNKSALAYRMWPFFAAASCSHGGPRKGRAKTDSTGNDFPLISSASIAVRIGVSEKLVDQAKSVHAYFSKHPEKKTQLEPLILLNLLPLHRVKEQEEGEQRRKTSSLSEISSFFKRMPEPFKRWEHMGSEEQRRASDIVAGTLCKLPLAVQVAVLETLEVALRN